MSEDSEDPVIKIVQPTIKTDRRGKVLIAIDQAKECLNIKEVIGQMETDCIGLGPSVTKWWSKAEGEQRVMNEM